MQEFTGTEYIQIDIANNFGHDKLTWEERLSWTQSQNNLYGLLDQADEPMLMLKGIKALEDARAGNPTGFIMGMDATASGIQIMGALMGCKKTCENVNLINTGSREDIYTKIPEVMNTQYTRSQVKKPIMTHFYGSLAQPKDVFGEDTPELHRFYDTLEEELPGAMECMEDIQGCWDPEALKYEWKLPDGHTAVMHVIETIDKKIEVDELNHATFTFRGKVNKAQKRGISLAANVVHSIDGWIVREMFIRARNQGFEMLAIHDSFWCSPNHVNKLRKNYINIMAEISKGSMLQDILRDITRTSIEHIKINDDISKDILTAEYALS